MAKTKNAQATTKKAPATEIVRTLEGRKVPTAELAHIAPHLRPFAVPVPSLKRDPRNARKHGENDLAKTAASLKRFGQQELLQFEPETRVLKVGNGRHEIAAETLGWKWVAAVPSDLPAADLKAFAIAHNKTGELAGWDREELLRQVESVRSSIDLDALGFDEAEIDKLAEDIKTSIAGPLEEGKEKNFGPARAESQPRLDQRKPVRCPSCDHEFVPPKS
jgi:ParB family chromosome partitioning protein